MSLESDVVTVLRADTGVAALVGTRIYPFRLPQDTTLPAITYHVVTGEDMGDHASATGGVVNALMQFDCWASGDHGAEGFSTVINLARKVRDALDAAATFKVGRFTYRDLYDSASELAGLPRRIVEASLWQNT